MKHSECHNAMLLLDMNISMFVNHYHHAEGEKNSKHANENNKDRTCNMSTLVKRQAMEIELSFSRNH